MKTGLALLMAIHGTIHLFGFLKAFEVADFSTITHPVSRAFGLIWLLAFVLFAAALVLKFYCFERWWAIGSVAVIISQFLIFNYWFDAKFGTIANIIILGVLLVAYSTFQFNKKVREERKLMFENSKTVDQKIITKETISNLPQIVQKWLIYSGAVGKEPISNVHLIQSLQLKMKEDQKAWNTAEADQYFTTEPPAFNWKTSIHMNSIINVVGRDKFESGGGEMSIKMFGIVPIADVKNSAKTNEATLQRYLAEIVWFPTAALSPYIKWEPIDDISTKAIMNYRGTECSGIFHFDSSGEFIKFTAMRFKDVKDDERKLWTVNAIKTAERDGIKIPVECEAKWKLPNQDWTWLKLKIIDIEYNLEEVRVTNKD